MDYDEPRLTRADFPDQDAWFRHCRQGGLDPFVDAELAVWESLGGGPNAALFGAIYGSTPELLQRTLDGGWSPHINIAEFERAYRGVCYANCRGWELDTFVTITWSMLGVTTDEAVDRCQARLLYDLQAWCDQADLSPVWVWALERGSRRGLHTHMLLSIDGIIMSVFRAWLYETLERITGGKLIWTEELTTVDVRPLHGQGLAAQWSVFRYLFKGLDPRLTWVDTQAGRETSLAGLAALTLSNEGETIATRTGVSWPLQPESIRDWLVTQDLPGLAKPGGATHTGGLYDSMFLRWVEELVRAARWPG